MNARKLNDIAGDGGVLFGSVRHGDMESSLDRYLNDFQVRSLTEKGL